MRRALLSATSMLAACAALAEPLQFDFTARDTLPESPEYDPTRGSGIEPGSTPSHVHFSVKLAEGNYRVTVRAGDRKAESTLTVCAEARRLMVERFTTTQGEYSTRSFLVNVRTPALPPPPANAPGGNAVRLPPADLASRTWDDKLTLEFIGTTTSVAHITIEPADVPTIYLAGDSTVTDVTSEPDASWGQMLPTFFAGDVAIANHARSGETLKSFLAALRLDKILSTLRAGDWVLVQFGHNDQKQQWPQTYVEATTTYRDYLRTYISEVRRRGAIPILVTSPERGKLDANGRVVDSHGDYPEAVRAVAREQRVALIDLTATSRSLYESLGPDRIGRLFADGGRDRTHHSIAGACELARLVVAGIRSADPQLAGPLAGHLATNSAGVTCHLSGENSAGTY